MSVNSIATFVGWSVLPNLITNVVQSFLDKNIRTPLYVPAVKGTSGYVTNRKVSLSPGSIFGKGCSILMDFVH